MNLNRNQDTKKLSLAGQFLVAMPQFENSTFSNSVIFICEHDEEGAMGLIVNKPASLEVQELFARTDIEPAQARMINQPVYCGGPVSSDRGFVLHSADRVWDSSLIINQQTALTTSLEVLQSIANGHDCPSNYLIALGCANWSPGQLENELSMNFWLTCPFDQQLLFSEPVQRRYQSTFSTMGFDPTAISSFVGHA